MATHTKQDSEAVYRRRISELEQALNDTQIYNQRLLQQVPAMISVMQGSDHRFNFVNQQFLDTLGMDQSIIGEPIAEVLPEFAEQGLVDLLDMVFTTGKSYHGSEQRVLLPASAPGEQVRFFNFVNQPIKKDDGSVSGLFIHSIDVTDLVRARQKSDELAAELEAIFSSMPDGVFIAKDDVITRVNQRGAESLGYESPATMPRKIADLYNELHLRFSASGRNLDVSNSTLMQALRGKAVNHQSVHVTNPTTGKEQVLRTAGAPIFSPNGDVIGAISVNNDITEQYNLQEKINKNKVQQRVLRQKAKLLKLQNEQLLEINKSKDEFIALASHQLRTPATSVKQYLGMLLEGYAGELSAKQQDFLERAYKGNERQLRIVEDILRVAQVDLDKMQLHMQEVDVCQLIEHVTQDQASRFQDRDQVLSVDRPKNSITIWADHDRLRMAIDNVVDNASKYTAPGKSIAILVAYKHRPDAVVIRVRDEGVGIAKADTPKLFQKFSRIHNPYSIETGGSGLGLYWTKKIIDLHGGTIRVSSRVGKGTTFTITLPLVDVADHSSIT